MFVRYICINCGRKCKSAQEYTGLKVKCAQCGVLQEIPTPEIVPVDPIEVYSSPPSDPQETIFIRYICANCGRKCKSAEKYAGQKVNCFQCGMLLRIPRQRSIANNPIEVHYFPPSNPQVASDFKAKLGMDEIKQPQYTESVKGTDKSFWRKLRFTVNVLLSVISRFCSLCSITNTNPAAQNTKVKIETVAKWIIDYPGRFMYLVNISCMVLLFLTLITLYMHWFAAMIFVVFMGILSGFMLYLALNSKLWKYAVVILEKISTNERE